MAKDNEKKTQLNLLDRIADAVEDIASGGGGGGGGGGGSELPAVTSDDNGKVLGVVEGEWAVANAGGGLVVNATIEGNTVTMDKTWQEIFDAVSAGMSVVLASDSFAMTITNVSSQNGYSVSTAEDVFIASTADDYPSMAV